MKCNYDFKTCPKCGSDNCEVGILRFPCTPEHKGEPPYLVRTAVCRACDKTFSIRETDLDLGPCNLSGACG
jgi:hypothetical protein